MSYQKILYVSNEIEPYLPENYMSSLSRQLPQEASDAGKEIRVFMPRFGKVNERRHQLHEVIRLSGMNMIVDDTDHPLIIKVASIQPTRMQVYFIDNEEYFRRKATFWDENKKFFPDNDERMIFFCRGVFETVKKLGWSPDIIHCQGWMTSLMPLFLKTIYKEDPLFSETKAVISIYDRHFPDKFDARIAEKALYEGMSPADTELLKEADYSAVCKTGIKFSDGVVFGSENIADDIRAYAATSGKPLLDAQPTENLMDTFSSFYEEVAEENSVMAE